MTNPSNAYNTSAEIGIDVNALFILDSSTPEYPNPPFLPGTVADGTDGSRWVYCTASITLAPGSAVLLSEVPGSWSVALVGGATVSSANAPQGQLVGVVGGNAGTLAVPAPSGTQIGMYFWTQVRGNCPNVLNSGSAGAISKLLYSNATLGGALNSTPGGIGTTYTVNGIVFTQTTASLAGPNTAVLNDPSIGLPT